MTARVKEFSADTSKELVKKVNRWLKKTKTHMSDKDWNIIPLSGVTDNIGESQVSVLIAFEKDD